MTGVQTCALPIYFRLSAHRIEIPPLRERLEDIKDLVEYFLETEKPKRNKTFDPQAVAALMKYNWPGNVRELKRICEQLVLTSPLPIIREQDFSNLFMKAAGTESGADLSLDLSLADFLSRNEKRFIEFCLQQTSDLDRACEILKISKSNLYKKIKELGISHE